METRRRLDFSESSLQTQVSSGQSWREGYSFQTWNEILYYTLLYPVQEKKYIIRVLSKIFLHPSRALEESSNLEKNRRWNFKITPLVLLNFDFIERQAILTGGKFQDASFKAIRPKITEIIDNKFERNEDTPPLIFPEFDQRQQEIHQIVDVICTSYPKLFRSSEVVPIIIQLFGESLMNDDITFVKNAKKFFKKSGIKFITVKFAETKKYVPNSEKVIYSGQQVSTETLRPEFVEETRSTTRTIAFDPITLWDISPTQSSKFIMKNDFYRVPLVVSLENLLLGIFQVFSDGVSRSSLTSTEILAEAASSQTMRHQIANKQEEQQLLF